MRQPLGYRLARHVVGYVRMSKETEAGLSIDAQTAKIHAMAEIRGVTVAQMFADDGASGKSLDRPEMGRLLDLVFTGAVQTVIVAKLDRLTRSLRDLLTLMDHFEKEDVALVSIAESLDTRSSAGRLVVHIMASVGDWERREIGTRTREVLQHIRRNGERVGTVPFGFRLTPTATPEGRRSKTGRHVQLEPAPVEQRMLAQMRALRDEGKSDQDIADDLRHQGLTTRRGTPYQPRYVAHTLRAWKRA